MKVLNKAVRVLKVRYYNTQNIAMPPAIKITIQLIRPGTVACPHFQDCRSNESNLPSFGPPVWSRLPARTKFNQQCVRPLIEKEVKSTYKPTGPSGQRLSRFL